MRLPAVPGFARVTACALWGVEAELVSVEVDVANGLPAFDIVGLPDAALREARERVRAAIRNSGFDFPLRRVTVSLAPAERKKEGSGFDLAIALGILRASDQLAAEVTLCCIGELGLDGSVRPVRGVLPRARGAAKRGVVQVLVARENGEEAAAAGGDAIAVRTLREAVAHLDGSQRLAPTPAPVWSAEPSGAGELADIAGQATPKRALEVAAAGGHNLLLVGPPGTGKTMLARAIASIMPPLDIDEAIEASAVHSVAGLVEAERPILAARPFRAPHHTASRLALVGGGNPPRPGEASLAHTGTLFLDEVAEFNRGILETLREPLQEGEITLARAGSRATYPARFTLVAACNPCPCGLAGDPERQCTCLPDAVERYRARISGPVLDRIDLRTHVPRVPFEDLRAERGTRERSASVRERVTRARERMRERGCRSNAELDLPALRRHCSLNAAGERLVGAAVHERRLSARAYHRTLRVARTIADLDGAATIGADHVATALLLRA